MSISEKWYQLTPDKRSLYSKIILGAVVVLGGSWMWSIQKDSQSPKTEPAAQFGQLGIGEELFKEDVSTSIQKTKSDMEEMNNAQDIKIKDQDTKMDSLAAVLQGIEGKLDRLSDENLKPPANREDEEYIDSSSIIAPRFPQPPVNNSINNFSNQSQFTELESAPAIIGGISHVQGDPLLAQQQTQKKKGRRVYLPASFMDAQLLTGLDASTVEGANAHPQPFMIRVQKPAVLPNSIKANLKGCFVIAHGYGALNSERVESRLVSLNCLSEDGEAIIDTRIKGFVADSDGKSGLKGHVVSKQGANLARAFFAGVVGGIGKVAETSSNTLMIAPITGTSTSVLEPSKVAQAGLGAGLAESSKDLRKFYLDMAKQSSPVIEVGPAKKVTVVITEGIWLEIRENGNKNEND